MNWTDPPLRLGYKYSLVQLIRVPRGAVWRGVVTATRFATKHTHFMDGRTQPCLADTGACHACALGLNKRMEAYLGWHNLSRRVSQVLALPEGAYVGAADLCAEHLDGKMRGEMLQFSRPAGSRRAQLTVERLGRESDRASIPHGVDVPGILRRCWGLPDLEIVRPLPAEARAILKKIGDA